MVRLAIVVGERRGGGMPKKILILNGHPDARPERLCTALANAYVRGAIVGGHEIRRMDVGAMRFALIRSQADFVDDEAAPDVQRAQADLRWADHLLIVHPLWLGGMPAVLKGFLEQVFRYGVALSPPGGPPRGLLRGKSARVVVTMGMPAFVFRWVFGAHGLRSLERGVLWISGFKPIRRVIIGNVEGATLKVRARWLKAMERYGAAAA